MSILWPYQQYYLLYSSNQKVFYILSADKWLASELIMSSDLLKWAYSVNIGFLATAIWQAVIIFWYSVCIPQYLFNVLNILLPVSSCFMEYRLSSLITLEVSGGICWKCIPVCCLRWGMSSCLPLYPSVCHSACIRVRVCVCLCIWVCVCVCVCVSMFAFMWVSEAFQSNGTSVAYTGCHLTWLACEGVPSLKQTVYGVFVTLS